MNIEIMTETELSAAIKTELARIVAETKKVENQYGDVDRDPAGCYREYGRHPRGARRSEIVGWTKDGPEKRVVHVTSVHLEQLCEQRKKLRTSAKKAAKKAEEKAAAQAAGFASVAAWKRSEKARKERETKEAVAVAAAEREARRLKNIERLEALGFGEHDLDYVPVLGVLEAAAADGFDIEHEHARAARYAMRTNSSAWQAYCEGELSACQLLYRCERAQNRHENTDYDDLLRAGYDRESAREMCEQY